MIGKRLYSLPAVYEFIAILLILCLPAGYEELLGTFNGIFRNDCNSTDIVFDFQECNLVIWEPRSKQSMFTSFVDQWSLAQSLKFSANTNLVLDSNTWNKWA